MLLQLLARFPRADVSRLIVNMPDPDGAEHQLLNGTTLDRLKRAAADKQRPLPLHAAQFDGRVIGWFDREYPEVWRHIADPPLVYFTRGAALAELASRYRLIAVVGARKATQYGRSVSSELAWHLSHNGCAVVSGLAYGIDVAAHKGCLQARGVTVGILGGGLDRIYPAAHRQIGAQIIACGGCLVSEYAPESRARPFHFLERNRLISGLCGSIVVVEAAQRSGALNTARWALEQGREVWAVPGNVHNPQARGCHQLIDEGARIFSDWSDIVGEVVQPSPPDDPHKRQILTLCQTQAMSLDALLLALSGDVEYTQLITLLGDMEVSGIVQSTPLGYIATSKST